MCFCRGMFCHYVMCLKIVLIIMWYDLVVMWCAFVVMWCAFVTVWCALASPYHYVIWLCRYVMCFCRYVVCFCHCVMCFCPYHHVIWFCRYVVCFCDVNFVVLWCALICHDGRGADSMQELSVKKLQRACILNNSFDVIFYCSEGELFAELSNAWDPLNFPVVGRPVVATTV